MSHKSARQQSLEANARRLTVTTKPSLPTSGIGYHQADSAPRGGQRHYSEADKAQYWADRAKSDASKKLAWLDRELKPITNVGKQMQHIVMCLRKQGVNARDAQLKAAQLLKAYHTAKSLVTA